MEFNGTLYEPRDIELIGGEEEEIIVRIRKRYVRDAQNPFDFFRDEDFKKRYRFSKASVMNEILPRIEEALLKGNNRGLPVTPVFQLLACLRFYATGSFQLVNGDLMSLSQSTISRIVFRVSTLLAAHMHQLVKIPNTEEQRRQNMQLFQDLGKGRGDIGLLGVEGAIDCTHIQLRNTGFQNIREVYRNRKGYFSLNVQAVVGPSMEFLDIVPEWPGSQHDSRILQNSRVYMRYMEGKLTDMLVGDSGYPCLPFLLTPIANPVTDAQQSYNEVQSRTRIIVERVFGTWKRRFPCLSKGLSTKLICSTTIVVACAVLHNLSLILNDLLPYDNEEIEDDEVPVEPPNWQAGDGFAVRQALIDCLFN